MAGSILSNFEDLENMLKSVEAGFQAVPPKTDFQQASEAMRRYSARKIDRIYTNAVKVMGEEPEFSSTRYIVTGLAGLLSDSLFTLWESTREILKSPLVKEMIDEKAGKGKTLADYLFKNQGGAEKAAARIVDEHEIHVKNLIAYSKETGRSFDAILKSSRDRLVLIERNYGSLEKYEERNEETSKSLTSVIKQIDLLKIMPWRIIVSAYLAKEFEAQEMLKLGLNPAVLGSITKDYLKDAAKFGKAFLAEFVKYDAAEIKKYKILKTERESKA
jgi:hypothetical protein